MRIGLYDPYIDAFGGGERYMLTLASHWSKTHIVEIYWNSPSDIAICAERFGLDISRVVIKPDIFVGSGLMQKIWQTGKLDVLFVLSDGSIPVSVAAKNILHFQFPVSIPVTESWKLWRYHKIVCNSAFTRMNLSPGLLQKSYVIYPPVDVLKFKKARKQKMILTVGRFSAHHHMKKQGELIEAFIKAQKSGLFKNWQFHLAGSLHADDRQYFLELQDLARGYSIEFHTDCSFSDLVQLYSKASLYWHGAGFGESDPMLAEHFGITTVEAMASGCIPISYAGGGQPEIITHGNNGFLWTGIDELIDYSLNAAKVGNNTEKIRASALIRSKDFSIEKFTNGFDHLLEMI